MSSLNDRPAHHARWAYHAHWAQHARRVHRVRWAGLVMVVCLLFVSPAGAQPVTGEVADTVQTPGAVVGRYLSAFRAAEWKRCAALMHPKALQGLKDVLAEASDSSAHLAEALYGKGAPRETIRYAPPQELYGRFLAVVHEQVPRQQRLLQSINAHILGTVAESDSLAHVVVRTRADLDEQQISQVEVLTARRYRGGWRVLPTTDVKNLAAALQP